MKEKAVLFMLENKKAVAAAAITFVTICVLFAIVNCARYRVAVVDVQAIVAKSSQVVALRQDQEQKLQVLQSWINDVNKKVEKEKNKKDKEEMLAKYNQEFAQKQQQIGQDYAQKLKVIDANITNIIKQQAKKLGYDMVASKGVVLYGAEDITSQVAAQIQ